MKRGSTITNQNKSSLLRKLFWMVVLIFPITIIGSNYYTILMLQYANGASDDNKQVVIMKKSDNTEMNENISILPPNKSNQRERIRTKAEELLCTNAVKKKKTILPFLITQYN